MKGWNEETKTDVDALYVLNFGGGGLNTASNCRKRLKGARQNCNYVTTLKHLGCRSLMKTHLQILGRVHAHVGQSRDMK